ncbi:hypothetical protein EDB82DRAFT_472070 [Fusarium venenatum]|uniref:uncharacterized protein n=1 Tax=Fusarium venenatum TaxID=56646 RepID=UPI001DD9952C|nr:hypothetical protein EDB82DRAFT_472070 [Fusarium venenatum]
MARCSRWAANILSKSGHPDPNIGLLILFIELRERSQDQSMNRHWLTRPCGPLSFEATLGRPSRTSQGSVEPLRQMTTIYLGACTWCLLETMNPSCTEGSEFPA